MDTSGTSTWTAGQALNTGDLVTVSEVPVYRKWWQIWKPRQWTEQRAFKVIAHRAFDPRDEALDPGVVSCNQTDKQ